MKMIEGENIYDMAYSYLPCTASAHPHVSNGFSLAVSINTACLHHSRQGDTELALLDRPQISSAELQSKARLKRETLICSNQEAPISELLLHLVCNWACYSKDDTRGWVDCWRLCCLLFTLPVKVYEVYKSNICQQPIIAWLLQRGICFPSHTPWVILYYFLLCSQSHCLLWI